MMKVFKNKRYWILMPPTLLIGISLIIFIPNNDGFPYAFSSLVLFWIVYYTCTYYAEKKNNRQNKESL